ncbi:MAG: hypothetical protein ABIK08_04050 [Pseudomonadota bacterium]
MSDHPEHDPAAALELIKAAQRKPQTHNAVLDFLDKPPALLNGDEHPKGNRGPASTLTYHQIRGKRINTALYLLMALPGMGAAVRREAWTPLRRVADEVARTIPAETPEHDLTRLVSDGLERKGLNYSVKAVREALRWLGRIEKKPPEIDTPTI